MILIHYTYYYYYYYYIRTQRIYHVVLSVTGIPTSSYFSKGLLSAAVVVLQVGIRIIMIIRLYKKNTVHSQRTEFITQNIIYIKDGRNLYIYLSIVDGIYTSAQCIFAVVGINTIDYTYLRCFNNEMSIFESDCCLLNTYIVPATA